MLWYQPSPLVSVAKIRAPEQTDAGEMHTREAGPAHCIYTAVLHEEYFAVILLLLVSVKNLLVLINFNLSWLFLAFSSFATEL